MLFHKQKFNAEEAKRVKRDKEVTRKEAMLDSADPKTLLAFSTAGAATGSTGIRRSRTGGRWGPSWDGNTAEGADELLTHLRSLLGTSALPNGRA